MVSAAVVALGDLGAVWQAVTRMGGGLDPLSPQGQSGRSEPVPPEAGSNATPTPPHRPGKRDVGPLWPFPLPELPDKPPARAQPPPSPTGSATPQPDRSAGDGASAGSDAGVAGPEPQEPQEPEEPQARRKRARLASAVVRLTNARRVDAGCHPLRVDEQLQQAAVRKSAHMARNDYFAHTSPGGLSPWELVRAAGYADPSGENIARGQESARAVVRGWMLSQGHRKNILNCAAEAIGVGVVHAEDGSGPYWTQVFGYE